MNKKAAAIVGGILVLGLGVFGFTKLNSGSQNQQTQQEQSAEQTTVQITDANGEKAELKKNPKRVVVFDYGVADILKNLGVDAVVGLPKNGKMPEILSNYSDDKYTNVGSLKETDFEAVESLNPDLIIIGGRQAEDIDSFKEIAPTVNLATDGQNYMNSFSQVVTDLGNLFDKQDEAKKALNEINEKVADLKKTIEEKDERNQMIRNKAQAISGKVIHWALMAGAWIAIFFDAPLWITLAFVGVFLLKTALDIVFTAYYQKRM